MLALSVFRFENSIFYMIFVFLSPHEYIHIPVLCRLSVSFEHTYMKIYANVCASKRMQHNRYGYEKEVMLTQW